MSLQSCEVAVVVQDDVAECRESLFFELVEVGELPINDEQILCDLTSIRGQFKSHGAILNERGRIPMLVILTVQVGLIGQLVL